MRYFPSPAFALLPAAAPDNPRGAVLDRCHGAALCDPTRGPHANKRMVHHSAIIVATGSINSHSDGSTRP